MSSLYHRPLEVWRPTSVADGSGGQTETNTNVVTLMGKVDQPSARDQLVAAQGGAELTHVVYFDGIVDVRRGDDLRGDGDVFEVISVVRPSTPVYTRANCELDQSEKS